MQRVWVIINKAVCIFYGNTRGERFLRDWERDWDEREEGRRKKCELMWGERRVVLVHYFLSCGNQELQASSAISQRAAALLPVSYSETTEVLFNNSSTSTTYTTHPLHCSVFQRCSRWKAAFGNWQPLQRRPHKPRAQPPGAGWKFSGTRTWLIIFRFVLEFVLSSGSVQRTLRRATDESSMIATHFYSPLLLAHNYEMLKIEFVCSASLLALLVVSTHPFNLFFQ